VVVAFREHTSNMSVVAASQVFSELDRVVERHRSPSLDALDGFDGVEFTRWVAAEQRRVGNRVAAARAYLRGAVAYRSPGLLARALVVPLGERAMGLHDRLRARGAREEPPVPAPDWLERSRGPLLASAHHGQWQSVG
jgi:hypothetical protein